MSKTNYEIPTIARQGDPRYQHALPSSAGCLPMVVGCVMLVIIALAMVIVVFGR